MNAGISGLARRAVIAIAIGLIAVAGVGGAPASAQAPDPTPVPGASLPLPIECSELDARADLPDSNGDGIVDDCVDFYFNQVVLPPPSSTTTTTTVAGNLPQTGSSVSPALAIGAALVVGGAMAVVATRRRSMVTSG